MKTNQPVWKYLAQLGDAHPLDHGGYWVHTDETGVYSPEGELLVSPDEEPAPDVAAYEVRRVCLDQCFYTNGVLSDNKFHKDHPAWFADSIEKIASFIGQPVETLRDWLCGDDICCRAEAYRAIGDYYGWDSLDSYPLRLTRAEVEVRYAQAIYHPQSAAGTKQQPKDET